VQKPFILAEDDAGLLCGEDAGLLCGEDAGLLCGEDARLLQKVQGFAEDDVGLCSRRYRGFVWRRCRALQKMIQGSVQKKMQGFCVATYPDVGGGMTHSHVGGGTTHRNALLKTWGSFEKIQGTFENL